MIIIILLNMYKHNVYIINHTQYITYRLVCFSSAIITCVSGNNHHRFNLCTPCYNTTYSHQFPNRVCFHFSYFNRFASAQVVKINFTENGNTTVWYIIFATVNTKMITIFMFITESLFTIIHFSFQQLHITF